jgi:hypothetical protein
LRRRRRRAQRANAYSVLAEPFPNLWGALAAAVEGQGAPPAVGRAEL